MELWAHFPKHPNKDYRIVTGASFTDRLNETLDEGDVILAHVKKEDVFDIKPMDEVIVYSRDEADYFSVQTGVGKDGLPNRAYGRMYQGMERDLSSQSSYEREHGKRIGGFRYREIDSLGKPHEIFYAHMVVWDISEDPINIGTDYFNFHIKLMSETKVLENFLIPNRTVRQPQRASSANKRKIIALPDPNSATVAGKAGGVINELMSFYVKPKSVSLNGWQADKSAQEVLIDLDLYDLFKGEDGQPLICPEMHFPAGTLRSALAQIFYVVDCIPVVHDGVLTYMRISQKGSEIDSDFRRRSWKTSQMSGGEYADRLRRTYSNSLSQGTTTRFVERMGFRNSDAPLMTLGNMRLEFAHPIYKINKLLLCFYREKGTYSDYRISDGNATRQFTGNGRQTDFTFSTRIGSSTNVALSSGTTTDYADANGRWHNKLDSYNIAGLYVDIAFDNPPPSGVSFNVTLVPTSSPPLVLSAVGDGKQKVIRIDVGSVGIMSIIAAYLNGSYVAGTPFKIELPFSVVKQPNSDNGMISFAYPPSNGASFTVSYERIDNTPSQLGIDTWTGNNVIIEGGGSIDMSNYDKDDYLLSSCDVVKYDMTKLVLQNAVRNVLSEDWQQLNVILNNLRSGKYSVSDLAKFKMCTVGFDIGSKYVTGWGSLYQWMESIYNPQASYIENIIAILTAMYPGGTDSWDAKNFSDGDIYQIENEDYLVDKTTGMSINNNIAKIIPPAAYNTGAVNWIVGIIKNILAVNDDGADKNQTLRMKGVFFECEYEGFVEGAVEYTKDEHDGIVMKDDSQSAAFTYTSADGVQEKGKINRLGNKAVTMAARYKDLYSENIYGLTDYDEDSNIVYQRTFAIFKDYVAVSYIMCKDYVIRNYFTSVWSKKRPYGLASYGEAVKRNEIEHVQLLISPDQQYNWDLPFTFDVFDEASFVGDYLLSFWKSNYDWNNYGKQEKTTLSSSLVAHDGARYILEAQPFIAGIAYCVTVAMTDNVSAGQYILRFAPSVSGYGKAVWNRKANKYEPSNENERFGDLSIFDDLTGSVMDWYNTASETETGFSLSNNFCLFGVNQTEKEKSTRFLPSVLSVSDGVYRNDLLPLPKMPNWMADQSDNALKPAAFDYHLHTKTYMKDGQETLLDTFEFEPIKTKGMAFSKYFMLLSDLNDYYMKITLDTPVGQLDAPMFFSMASAYSPAGSVKGAQGYDTPYRMSVEYDIDHFPGARGSQWNNDYMYDSADRIGMNTSDWGSASTTAKSPMFVRDPGQNVSANMGNALLLTWCLPTDMADMTVGRVNSISNPSNIEIGGYVGDFETGWWAASTNFKCAYLSVTPYTYRIENETFGKVVRLHCEVATLFDGNYDSNGVRVSGFFEKDGDGNYSVFDEVYETYAEMNSAFNQGQISTGSTVYVRHDEHYQEQRGYYHPYPSFYRLVTPITLIRAGGALVYDEFITLFSKDAFSTDWAKQYNSPKTGFSSIDGSISTKYAENISIDNALTPFSGALTSVTCQCWYGVNSPVGASSSATRYVRMALTQTIGVGWSYCFYWATRLSNADVPANAGMYIKKASDYPILAAPINDKVNLVWRICPSIGDSFNPDACIIDIDNANFFAPSSFTSPTFDELNKTFSFSFSVSKEDVASSAELRGKSIRCYYYDDNDLLWHFVIGFNLSADAKFVDDMYEDDEDVTAEIKAFVSVLQTRENRVYDKATGDMIGKLVNFADKGTGFNLIPTSEHAWWTEDGSAQISLTGATCGMDYDYLLSFAQRARCKLWPTITVGNVVLKYQEDFILGEGSEIDFEVIDGSIFIESDTLSTNGEVVIYVLSLGHPTVTGVIQFNFSALENGSYIGATVAKNVTARWSDLQQRYVWEFEDAEP